MKSADAYILNTSKKKGYVYVALAFLSSVLKSESILFTNSSTEVIFG
tara:strand:+ start:2542 stop:2682 length:141 start_codon:yes stop_codon:yes gene_type:complete